MDIAFPSPDHELAQRAQRAGYEPARAIERFSYGSFVSPARRYMYMETPKVACTSFKHLIAGIEGLALDPAVAPPYQRETRTDMLIHQRRHFALPTLLTADARSRAEILGGTPGWMIFALVRNPFSRLVSFFEHKIRMGEPGYERMEARYGDAARLGGLQKSFAHFVEEVVADPGPRNIDVHMMPQNAIIMPRLVPYTNVFRLERVGNAIKSLGGHLGKPLPALAPGRTASRDWRTYYDAHSAGIVAEIYEEDFALFGYDSGDWRPRGEALPAQPAEEYWREEIVARKPSDPIAL